MCACAAKDEVATRTSNVQLNEVLPGEATYLVLPPAVLHQGLRAHVHGYAGAGAGVRVRGAVQRPFRVPVPARGPKAEGAWRMDMQDARDLPPAAR